MNDEHGGTKPPSPRRRVRIEVTLNKHTIEALGKLADSMGISRSAVIDKAVMNLVGQHLTYGLMGDKT